MSQCTPIENGACRNEGVERVPFLWRFSHLGRRGMSGLIKDIFLYSNCTPWNTSCLLSFCQTLLEREAALFPPGPVTGTLLSTLRAETRLLALRDAGTTDPADQDTPADALLGECANSSSTVVDRWRRHCHFQRCGSFVSAFLSYGHGVSCAGCVLCIRNHRVVHVRPEPRVVREVRRAMLCSRAAQPVLTLLPLEVSRMGSSQGDGFTALSPFLHFPFPVIENTAVSLLPSATACFGSSVILHLLSVLFCAFCAFIGQWRQLRRGAAHNPHPVLLRDELQRERVCGHRVRRQQPCSHGLCTYVAAMCSTPAPSCLRAHCANSSSK